MLNLILKVVLFFFKGETVLEALLTQMYGKENFFMLEPDLGDFNEYKEEQKELIEGKPKKEILQ